MAEKKQLKKAALIVEKSRDGDLYGRVLVNDNLLVIDAPTLEELKKNMLKLVWDVEHVKIEQMEIAYDLTSFFDQYKVNISDIATRTGINAGLMRQYASGVKYPSKERVALIEKAVHDYARELAKVRLVRSAGEFTSKS